MKKMAEVTKLLMCQRVYDFSKCHRNASNQTNPLQVDDIITSKSLRNFEASGRILNTQCQNIYSCKYKKYFKNVMINHAHRVPPG
jgi:hypothetical protein